MGICELIILLGFFQDYRRNRELCVILLKFIFGVFPVTFFLTLLIFYPLHNYTEFWYLIMFPFYIPFLFLYKTIIKYYNKNTRTEKKFNEAK